LDYKKSINRRTKNNIMKSFATYTFTKHCYSDNIKGGKKVVEESILRRKQNLHKLARNQKGRDVDGRIILQMDLTEIQTGISRRLF